MDLEEIDDISQQFQGGTLEINAETKCNNNKLSISSENVDNCNNKALLKNNLISSFISFPKYVTESVCGKGDSNSKEDNSVSLKPAAELVAEGNANNFFTFRRGVIEHAVKECVEQFLDAETDGSSWTAYLLTEISIWDTDKERLVLITPKNIVIIKYDFIALKRLEYQKLPLEHINSVIIGDLVYPSTSLIPHFNGLIDGVSNVVQRCLFDVWSKDKTDRNVSTYFQPRKRNMRGIRLMWNDSKSLKFGSKWNPLCNNVPFITFTTHPLFFHKECSCEEQRKAYDVEDFIENICSTIHAFRETSNDSSCIIHHKDIMLENYIGIGSLIHNRNALGYFKVRGRFSF